MEQDGIDFDARQIRLRNHGMPSSSWHSVALLHVVATACSYSPWRQDGLVAWGGNPFKRHVAATSAAAELYRRGYDMDTIVRRGLGRDLVGSIVDVAVRAAIDMAHRPDVSVPKGARTLGDRLVRAGGASAVPVDATMLLFEVAESDRYHLFTQRVAGWIETAPRIAELLCWQFPPDHDWEALDAAELSTDTDSAWILDRFLLTYLADWSTPSLHTEYRWNIGKHGSVLPATELDLRVVPDARLDAEIAKRAVLDDVPDTGDFMQLQEQTLELLEGGEHDVAVALLRGALFSSPRSPILRNNLAFCLLPVDAAAARDLWVTLRGERYRLLLTLANKATAELALGNCDEARQTVSELARVTSEGGQFVLWDLRKSPASLVRVEAPYEHVRSMMEDIC